MRDALQKGRLGISALSPRVTTGKEQWQEWHHDFFHNQMEDATKADQATHAAADRMDTDLEVITLRESQQTALEVRGVANVNLPPYSGFRGGHAVQCVELPC